MSDEKIICDKSSYPNLQQVNFAINGLTKRGVKHLYSYVCDECGLYHISSIKVAPFKHRRNKRDKKFSTAKPIPKKKFIPIKVTDEEIKAGNKKKKQTLTIAEGLQRFVKVFKDLK